jgi:hypothetical protein
MNTERIDRAVRHFEMLRRVGITCPMHWEAQRCIIAGMDEFDSDAPPSKQLWLIAARLDLPLGKAIELYELKNHIADFNKRPFAEQCDLTLSVLRHLRNTGDIEVTL